MGTYHRAQNPHNSKILIITFLAWKASWTPADQALPQLEGLEVLTLNTNMISDRGVALGNLEGQSLGRGGSGGTTCLTLLV